MELAPSDDDAPGSHAGPSDASELVVRLTLAASDFELLGAEDAAGMGL